MKELLLALPAGRSTQGAHFGLTPAHMAYRVGPGLRLLGQRLPDGLRGGLMLLSCAGLEGGGDPVNCCRQVLGECRRRGYRGIVCDFEGMPSDVLGRTAEILARNCAAQGWPLYVPEPYAPRAPGSRVLIPSAVTSGTLERRLREAAERYGPHRTALAVEWVREDFPLPAAGRGEPVDREALDFVYPHLAACAAPTKLTATQLKGRPLDEEIAENAAHTPYLRPLSQPKFRREQAGLTPAEQGSATHLVLQYLNFGDADVPAQIAVLEGKSLLTPQQAKAVDIPALERLLASPLARELRQAEAAGKPPLREYRFTLLVPAREYDPRASGEDAVLLQGVADLCFQTPRGLAIVDFKTDRVFTPEEIAARAQLYRPQLEAYSLALTRVLEKPVVRRILYFLAPGTALDL